MGQVNLAEHTGFLIRDACWVHASGIFWWKQHPALSEQDDETENTALSEQDKETKHITLSEQDEETENIALSVQDEETHSTF